MSDPTSPRAIARERRRKMDRWVVLTIMCAIAALTFILIIIGAMK